MTFALHMAEHFRCDRLRIKLSRSTCALRYVRDNGADRKNGRTPCTECPIGISHRRGEPHHDAPAIGSPVPASIPIAAPKKRGHIAWGFQKSRKAAAAAAAAAAVPEPAPPITTATPTQAAEPEPTTEEPIMPKTRTATCQDCTASFEVVTLTGKLPPAPFLVRLGRLEIECASLEAVEQLAARFGGVAG